MGRGALGRASQGPAVIASVSLQATGNQGPTHANARPTAPGMAAIGAPEAKRVRAGNSTPPEASASCYRVSQKCFEHWDICKGKSGVVHSFERPDVFAHFG